MMKYKILVVDDEENMLALLNRVLSKEGYQIVCAGSGEVGLKLAGENQFELAIVDLSMPEMEGIEVLAKLREINRQIPVIMITAFPSWEKEQTARRLGCADYLSKPLNMKLLKDRVKKNIEKNQV